MTGSGNGDLDCEAGSRPERSGLVSGPVDGAATSGDAVASAVDRMWPAASERFRQRLTVIEDYLAEVTLGRADSVAVDEAREAAHKLAGTLGLFGLTGGSVRARELDERLDDHPHYDPGTVERLAYLTNTIRSDIEDRSRGPSDDLAQSPAGETVVWMIGGDNSRSESIRWLLGGHGVEVESVDGATATDPSPSTRDGVDSVTVALPGLRRPRAVLVDLGDRRNLDGGVGGVDLVAALSTRLPDCTIVVLSADDDLVARKALLNAGASVVAGNRVGPGSVVDTLLEGAGAVSEPMVVVVGVDPRRRAEVVACFNAVGIAVEMLDGPTELVPTLNRLEPVGPDAIVIGPDMGTADTLDAGEIVSVLHADPLWSRYPTIIVVETWTDEGASRCRWLPARADGVEVQSDGWAAIAARLRRRLRRGVVGGVGRASPEVGLVHRLDLAWAASRRDGRPFSVILLDPVESESGAVVERRSAERPADVLERRLRTVFRPGDAMGRWIGGRLLVGFEAPPDVADRRLVECCREVSRIGMVCRGSAATAPMDAADLETLLAVAGQRIGNGDGSGSEHSRAPRTLLVEDDPIVAEIVVELLRAEGHEVEVLNNGKAAVERVTSPGLPDEFDLVLLDITLPGIDGFGVLRAMKATAHAGLVPVVVLSGRSHEHEVRTALSLGAVDHVTKPFSPQVLLRRTERALALPGP